MNGAVIVNPNQPGGSGGGLYRFLRSIPTWVLWLLVLVWSIPTVIESPPAGCVFIPVVLPGRRREEPCGRDGRVRAAARTGHGGGPW